MMHCPYGSRLVLMFEPWFVWEERKKKMRVVVESRHEEEQRKLFVVFVVQWFVLPWL